MSALFRLFLLTLLLASASLSTARAGGVYFDINKRDVRVPVCDAPSVLSAVKRTIARAEYAYRGGLTVETMDRVAQTSFTQNRKSPIARRYCRARAYLSNGRAHPLYYMIEEYAGFVGVSWNVEACLPGHDRWKVHDGYCRTVRR
ncbi:cytoplasmic protein [Breoghania sp.]|uniref:cytoplasmic protein n=1 Tax=Breoghania sp. TaxID=2065378 RepID=UPI002AAB67F3|nr:cytoplasmic protein [Breoghania sp.]